ncbi:MAG: sigma 54-interacting transcriptional regulator [Deltaproteobacteria bacterium]|nr:sigma 54-interacting transcriptional regulator [Deltaproteobacteria bacterium]
MLELTIQRGGRQLIRRPIGIDPITIGRSRSNALRFLDDEISREHCIIYSDNGKTFLEDLSTNGTHINGELTRHSELSAGDRITIGPWTLNVIKRVTASPTKTVISNTLATHVIDSNPTHKRAKSRRIEFTIESPNSSLMKRRLISDNITLGSDDSCDLKIDDAFVSRKHCRIINNGNELQLIDLASTNGTLVDKIRISKTALPPKGHFNIGQSTVRYIRTKPSDTVLQRNDQALGRMIGTSKMMLEVFSIIKKVASSDAIACITGESGTGKELAAKEIHDHSPRHDKPFVAINCGAMPSEIIESQLFGHERGAFTGALERSVGLFEQAHKGTLFLDEIGEMPLHLQTRLLRVIEERTVRRVGGREEIPIDVRIICATNRNLESLIRNGIFREDLFFRIYIVPIHLPSLRERKEEIPILVEHMLSILSEPGRDPILTTRAIKRLHDYSWPGNVRELRNTLKRALALCEKDIIDVDDLQIIPIQNHFKKESGLKENERSYLINILQNNRNNISMTAKKLGIARTTLQKKIQKYRITLSNKSPNE